MLLVAIEQIGSEINWGKWAVQEFSQLLEVHGRAFRSSIGLRLHKRFTTSQAKVVSR